MIASFAKIYQIIHYNKKTPFLLTKKNARQLFSSLLFKHTESKAKTKSNTFKLLLAPQYSLFCNPLLSCINMRKK